MNPRSRTIIVSNRLPVTVDVSGGKLELHQSAGGLVSALVPVCESGGGAWIGWPGMEHGPEIADSIRLGNGDRYTLMPVSLSASEVAQYYDGFCNDFIWPLFHDMQPAATCNASWWTAYLRVNRKFAVETCRIANSGDAIWVHDYHLMMCGQFLRGKCPGSRIGYFHHVPFPAPDVFEKLPWRKRLLRALMHYDLVGFQTERDKANFVSCLRRYISGVRVQHAMNTLYVTAGEICTGVGAFPISIDLRAFEKDALSRSVLLRMGEIRAAMPGCKLMLGVDRLDYTKGILQRLQAFEDLLEKYPELCEKTRLIQVVIPSRENVHRYAELRTEIQQKVSHINGRFSTVTWTPVALLHHSVSQPELVALYRAADIMLVTPLKDGMNLVAKEFCASRVNETGALILSEFAGAAHELQCGALLVNPYDCRAVSRALHAALVMPSSEQQRRMRLMREAIRDNDVYHWARCFESSLRARRQKPVEIAPVSTVLQFRTSVV